MVDKPTVKAPPEGWRPKQIVDREKLQLKIDYLNTLQKAYGEVKAIGVMADIGRRMQRVCDSIEEDLNLKNNASTS